MPARATEEQRRRVCERCSATFFDKPSKVRRFCSTVCQHEAARIRPKNDPRPCTVCGVLFMPHRSNGQARFCSKRCAWSATKGPEYNAAIARATATKRGNTMRDRGNCNTYRKRGGRHEHRVVAEQMLGRALAKGEVVHHKDHNRRNNDPSNLVVLRQGDHMREHGLGVPGQRPKGEPWKYRRRGQELPFAKLNDDAVRQIRAAVASGALQRVVGAQFDIPQSYVSQIVHGKRWSHVK